MSLYIHTNAYVCRKNMISLILSSERLNEMMMMKIVIIIIIIIIIIIKIIIIINK